MYDYGVLAINWVVTLQSQEFQVKSVAAEIQQIVASNADSSVLDLAARLKKWFGSDLKNGIFPKIDQTTVVWAMEASANPTVVSPDGTFTLPLMRLGTSDVFVAVSHFRSGRGLHFRYQAGGVPSTSGFIEVYDDDPDMSIKPGVARGKLTQMSPWKSKIFPQTARDWWIYVPAGLTGMDRPGVMIFQDGQSMKDYVPTCLDNLIAKKAIPPIVGIFLDPGMRSDGQSNRSVEYDTLSDLYARFLLEEILPETAKFVPISQNPNQRALAGLSSGAICAFTAAWQRPNEFRKVLSGIGSFTDISHGSDLKQGGHNYPYLIRLTTRKPIRVYLQDGINDLDNQYGNWPLANQSMAKALAFKGYDYTFTYGEGNHSDRHFRAVFPQMIKWLWR